MRERTKTPLPTPMCKKCGRTPDRITEYVNCAHANNTTPSNYVRRNEGTYNLDTHLFYCTSCYIELGEPLGTA